MKSWTEFVVGILGYFFCTVVIAVLILFGGVFIYEAITVEQSAEAVLFSFFVGSCLLQTGLIAFVGFAYWIIKMAFK